jgi:hypothetical protein
MAYSVPVAVLRPLWLALAASRAGLAGNADEAVLSASTASPNLSLSLDRHLGLTPDVVRLWRLQPSEEDQRFLNKL